MPGTGVFWNPVGNTPAAWYNLNNSDGLPTPVGVEFDTDIQVAGWTVPEVAPDLMKDYLYAFSPDVDQLWITGLDADETYDLYLYSQNGGSANSRTTFIVDGIPRTVINNGNTPGFQLGGNYTLYSNISPAADGRLSIRYSDAGAVGGAFNGFQLVGGFINSSPPIFSAPGRGRQIILDRGLQLAACELSPTFDFDVDRWADTNFTTINFQTDAPLHPILLPRMSAEQQWGRWAYEGSMHLASAELPFADNFVTIQYKDEMDGQYGKEQIMDVLPAVEAQYREWNALYPNTMAHTSFWGGQLTISQLRTYVRTCKPDLLSYESFPGFFGGREAWYAEMQKFRTVGLEGHDGTGREPIPYFQQTQGSRTAYSEPVPGEAFVRQQQFASWAFGFTGITQWLYRDPLFNNTTPGMDQIVAQMFTCRGDFEPTPMFGYVAETNRQSLNLGPALVRMVSADIRIIPGKVEGVEKPPIAGISTWLEGNQNTAGYTDYLTDIVPLGKDHLNPDFNNHSDVLVGYFRPLLEDNTGYTFVDGLCFMIVNGNAGGTTTITVNGQPFDAMGMNIPVDENGEPDPQAMAANTAEALGEWYHVAFDFQDSNVDSIVRLSRDTGEVELVPLEHYADSRYYFTLYLPGGTGDLFAFWDSSTPFPTITKPTLCAGDATLLAANWSAPTASVAEPNTMLWTLGIFLILYQTKQCGLFQFCTF